MRRKYRILFLFVTGFILRFIFSCCECENNTIAFTINNILIQNLDNSSEYIKPAGDTLNRDAVAFEIILNNNELSDELVANNLSIGFSHAIACECNTFYEPTNKIDSIVIVAQSRINAEYGPQTDVSDLFVGFLPETQNSQTNIYQSLDKVIEQLNQTKTFNNNFLKIQLFFTTSVDSSSISFQLKIFLSDESIISKETSIIYLK